MLASTLGGTDESANRLIQQRSLEISSKRLLEPEWGYCDKSEPRQEVSLIEVFVFTRYSISPAFQSDFIKFFLNHQDLPDEKRPFYWHVGDVYDAFLCFNPEL